MKLSFLKASAVKAAAKAKGKRVNNDFILNLDAKVGELIAAACSVHNGGRKTLDASVGSHVGAAPTRSPVRGMGEAS